MISRKHPSSSSKRFFFHPRRSINTSHPLSFTSSLTLSKEKLSMPPSSSSSSALLRERTSVKIISPAVINPNDDDGDDNMSNILDRSQKNTTATHINQQEHTGLGEPSSSSSSSSPLTPKNRISNSYYFKHQHIDGSRPREMAIKFSAPDYSPILNYVITNGFETNNTTTCNSNKKSINKDVHSITKDDGKNDETNDNAIDEYGFSPSFKRQKNYHNNKKKKQEITEKSTSSLSLAQQQQPVAHHHLLQLSTGCTRCGRPNHKSGRCNAYTTIVDDLCHYCGVEGHWAKQCPLKTHFEQVLKDAATEEKSILDNDLVVGNNTNNITSNNNKPEEDAMSILLKDGYFDDDDITNGNSNQEEIIDSKIDDDEKTKLLELAKKNNDNQAAALMRYSRTQKFKALLYESKVVNNTGTYVLASSESPRQRYVGTSTNIFNRIRQHFTGQGGAIFTKTLCRLRRVRPLPLIPLTAPTVRKANEEHYCDEMRQTFAQMRAFGIETVRGGAFCKLKHSNGDYFRIACCFRNDDRMVAHEIFKIRSREYAKSQNKSVVKGFSKKEPNASSSSSSDGDDENSSAIQTSVLLLNPVLAFEQSIGRASPNWIGKRETTIMTAGDINNNINNNNNNKQKHEEISIELIKNKDNDKTQMRIAPSPAAVEENGSHHQSSAAADIDDADLIQKHNNNITSLSSVSLTTDDDSALEGGTRSSNNNNNSNNGIEPAGASHHHYSSSSSSTLDHYFKLAKEKENQRIKSMMIRKQQKLHRARQEREMLERSNNNNHPRLHPNGVGGREHSNVVNKSHQTSSSSSSFNNSFQNLPIRTAAIIKKKKSKMKMKMNSVAHQNLF